MRKRPISHSFCSKCGMMTEHYKRENTLFCVNCNNPKPCSSSNLKICVRNDCEERATRIISEEKSFWLCEIHYKELINSITEGVLKEKEDAYWIQLGQKYSRELVFNPSQRHNPNKRNFNLEVKVEEND